MEIDMRMDLSMFDVNPQRFSHDQLIALNQLRHALERLSISIYRNNAKLFSVQACVMPAYDDLPPRIDFVVKEFVGETFVGPQLPLTKDLLEDGLLKESIISEICLGVNRLGEVYARNSR